MTPPRPWTALERADGNWGPVALNMGEQEGGEGASAAPLAAKIDRHIAPSIPAGSRAPRRTTGERGVWSSRRRWLARLW
jgi:hypothetical protein